MKFISTVFLAFVCIIGCQAKKNQVDEFNVPQCSTQTPNHHNAPLCGCVRLSPDTESFRIDIGTNTINTWAYSDYDCHPQAMLGALKDGCFDPLTEYQEGLGTEGKKVVRSVFFLKLPLFAGAVCDVGAALTLAASSGENLQAIWDLGMAIGDIAAVAARDLVHANATIEDKARHPRDFKLLE